MSVHAVFIREDTYYSILTTIFSKKEDADKYAERMRTSIDEVVWVEAWAVNDSLPEWDGEE